MRTSEGGLGGRSSSFPHSISSNLAMMLRISGKSTETMMTLWHGNTFHNFSTLCGKDTPRRWFPLTIKGRAKTLERGKQAKLGQCTKKVNEGKKSIQISLQHTILTYQLSFWKHKPKGGPSYSRQLVHQRPQTPQWVLMFLLLNQYNYYWFDTSWGSCDVTAITVNPDYIMISTILIHRYQYSVYHKQIFLFPKLLMVWSILCLNSVLRKPR